MTDRFREFMPFTTLMENGKRINGYVNNPNDSGGETCWGICRKNHPNLKMWKSLDECKGIVAKRGYHLTEEELEEVYNVYYRQYYMKVNGEAYNDPRLALQVYDMAVNAGVKRAVMILQQLLHINVDGVAGRQTITCSNNRKGVFEAYVNARKNYYRSIGKGKNSVFLKGWLKRVDNCADFIK